MIKGDMRTRMEIASQEAEFIKGKYGAQSSEYINAQTTIVRIKREAAAQIQQIEEENAKAQDSGKLAAIDDAQAEAQAQLQTRRITNAKLLEMERQFEAARQAVRSGALVRQRDAIDPTRDPVRYAQAKAQIEILERQHQNRLSQIDRAGVLQRATMQRQAMAGIANDWAQHIARMATLQQGFSTTLRGMWDGLVGVFQQAIGRMVQNWIVGLLTQEGASRAFHMGEVLRLAKQAAAGAWAATAKIPIVGPIRAPIAAAAAFAGTIAYSSAEGGDWQVREGLYHLHKDEMVLPAWAASPLRSMLTTGSTPSRPANDFGGGGGATIVNNWTVQAWDGRDAKRALMDNKGHIAQALRKHLRDGGR